MSVPRFLHRSMIALGAIGVFLSAPALAAPDEFWPSGGNSLTVDGNPATNSNSFSTGANGATTLDAALHPSQLAALTTTWSIKSNVGGGGNTVYSKTVSFASQTIVTPGPMVTVSSITDCTVTSSASTCTKNVSFAAPATVGSYSVRIRPTATPGAPGALTTRDLVVNFSVTEPEPEMLETKLTVAKQCAILNAGNIDLTATLEELLSGDPISGADVDFYIDPELDGNGLPTASSTPVGSATTVGGLATLSHNINGLGAGDHNLYAEFDGDSQYFPSNDSDTLGISYLFVGFQPPINPEGNSVFGNGRVIPIKIKLVDANLAPVTDATPTVWMTQYSQSTGLGDVLEAATSVSAADTDNTMRFVPEDQQYIYNWDLSSLENGTYAVVVDLGDSAACSQGPYYAVITVAKKGGKK